MRERNRSVEYLFLLIFRASLSENEVHEIMKKPRKLTAKIKKNSKSVIKSTIVRVKCYDCVRLNIKHCEKY